MIDGEFNFKALARKLVEDKLVSLDRSAIDPTPIS